MAVAAQSYANQIISEIFDVLYLINVPFWYSVNA